MNELNEILKYMVDAFTQEKIARKVYEANRTTANIQRATDAFWTARDIEAEYKRVAATHNVCPIKAHDALLKAAEAAEAAVIAREARLSLAA